MNERMIKAVSDILFQTDPAGCMSPRKDEYKSEARIIVEVVEAEGDIQFPVLESIFDARFSGYYDITLLEEAHRDIKDAIQRF